jgi:hypothetical protein
MVHTYNASSREAEDHEFQANLGHVGKVWLNPPKTANQLTFVAEDTISKTLIPIKPTGQECLPYFFPIFFGVDASIP